MLSNDLAYQSQALQQRYRSGARWFFWIAGLTIVTSLMALSGAGFAFFLQPRRDAIYRRRGQRPGHRDG